MKGIALALMLLVAGSCSEAVDVEDRVAFGLNALIDEKLRRTPPGAVVLEGGGGGDSGANSSELHYSTGYSRRVAGRAEQPSAPDLILNQLREATEQWLTARSPRVGLRGDSELNGQVTHFCFVYYLQDGIGWLDVRGVWGEQGWIDKVYVVISEHTW